MTEDKFQKIREAQDYIEANLKEHIIEGSFKTRIFDEGEGETLLFISPYLFIYAYQLLELKKRYRVIWYSWREAEDNNSPISMEQRIQDNLMIPKYLTLEDINVVSVCHVGPVISAIARKPQLFKSLFITNGFVYAPASLFDRISLKFVNLIPEEAIVERTSKKLAFDPAERAFIFERLMTIKHVKTLFITGIMPFLFADMREDLNKLNIPAKVILTQKDSYVGMKYMEYVCDTLQSAEKEVMDSLQGHFISILEPDKYINKLENFLKNQNRR